MVSDELSLPVLTNVDVIKDLLAGVEATPSRSRGQNFLIAPGIITKTIETIAGGPMQATELGSGLGVLTQALIMAGYQVKAIEQDNNFVTILPTIIPPNKQSALEIVHGDLRHVDWTWPTPYMVIGNIPYNLSGLIFRKLTSLVPAPTAAIFLVQKEVADRLMAKSPDMNLLALSVQLWGTPTMISDVPAHCFWPQPKVASALVQITPYAMPLLTHQEREQLMGVARQLFQGRRKQIGKKLEQLFGLEASRQALATATLRPEQRPQEISVAQWVTLHANLRYT